MFDLHKERNTDSPQALRNLFVQIKDIITRVCSQEIDEENTLEELDYQTRIHYASKLLYYVSDFTKLKLENTFYVFYLQITPDNISIPLNSLDFIPKLTPNAKEDFNLYYEIYKNSSIMLAEIDGHPTPTIDDLFPITRVIRMAAATHYGYILHVVGELASKDNTFQVILHSTMLTPPLFNIVIEKLTQEIPLAKEVRYHKDLSEEELKRDWFWLFL